MIKAFHRIFVLDFEFTKKPGCRPIPICLVVKEIITGKVESYWIEEGGMPPPPIHFGQDDLCVCYYAMAELSCFLALGWPFPSNIIDLWVELRGITNGNAGGDNLSLMQATKYFGIDVDFGNKQSMRDLAMRGGFYSPEERIDLLTYCENDVEATAKLYEAMKGLFSHIHALFRGRYLCAAAKVEHMGVPIDWAAYSLLTSRWTVVRKTLLEELDVEFGVLEDGSLKQSKLENFVGGMGITWPRTLTGKLRTDRDTLKEMATIYPELEKLRQLLRLLGQLNTPKISVGLDNRNRYFTGVFSSRTGRNQPSDGCIWGLQALMRGFIQPDPGMAIVNLDYAQEEFAISAALSGDKAMAEAYTSGDPYLAFAKQAGAVPDHATKESHPRERELYKTTALGVLYGMGADTLAKRLGISISGARRLLQTHRLTYRKFWAWSDAFVNNALLLRRVRSRLDWGMNVHQRTKQTTLFNYPMQANGAEILRLATINAVESGARVISMVHDALVIEVPIDDIDEHIQLTTTAMEKAGEAILSGFRLKIDIEITKYPDRLLPAKGKAMWDRIGSIIGGNFPVTQPH